MTEENTRRSFLKTASSLSVTLPLAGCIGNPINLSANAAPLERPGIIGHGDFQYTADKQWSKLSAHLKPVVHFHEMVLDARGRLACTVVSDKCDLLLYNKDGKVVDTINHNVKEPHGLTLAGEGSDQTFWVTDSAGGRVINLDLDGRLVRELSAPAEEIPTGKAFRPTETTVTERGDIYVADGYGSNKIFHYDSQGRLKNVFGGPDHFSCCHGIVVDGRRGMEELLITSRSNQNFQRWSLDGRHLQTYELPGLKVCRPVTSGEHTLFAVIWTKSNWHYDGMIAVLDKDFEVVSLPGGSAPTTQTSFRDVEWDGRTLLNPHDVCLDQDDNIYVPQWLSGMTQPVRLRRV
ncbi:NHL repeat-containing protein [Neolewinella antarctica]|uniref:Sugar lactone lactonase YvrE n=1 Tax=Neolewinella antarctica TaxID=442734 RepID=A0ABX0X7J2_9BACT|nr:6-bladed beta-propeller [Neolewinella antarctica]NJC25197.1 sugar lactone lactonase YvrE [Neolewinella antarctica]